MDTMTYNDNNKYTKGKMCLDKLVSEHDKQMIEKACNWIESNLCYYDENYRGIDSGNSLIEDFKQAMMEE